MNISRNKIAILKGEDYMLNGEVLETVNHTSYCIYREFHDRDEYFSGRFKKMIPVITEDWQIAKKYKTISNAIVAYKKIRELSDGDWQIRLDETICKTTWFVPHDSLWK